MENPPNDPIFHDLNPGVSANVNAVFRNDMIRDMILDYAMHDGKDVAISNVRSFRLVSKAFLLSTHRTLRKSQRLLFHIYLFKEGFTVGNNCSQKHEKLCQFLRLPTEGESWITAATPHSMEISHDFFCQQNHQSFLDYLANCGGSLIELAIYFPMNVNANIVIPLTTNFVLPKIQTLFAMIETEHVGAIEKSFDFVQRVLDASKQLQSLMFVCMTKVWVAPHIFAKMRLPSSLTKVEIQCSTSDTSLEILLNSPLPKLKTLLLYIGNAPVTDGLISRMLQSVRKTLVNLAIFQMGDITVNKRSTPFKLPLMELLEILQIETEYLELQGNLSCLQKRVPMLRNTSFTHQTNSMFRKWTDQSCFTSAQSLRASFVPENSLNNGNVQHNEFTLANLELRTMEGIARAFPNLVMLDIEFHVTGTELSSLVPLMREMKNLQQLRISVEDDGQLINSNAWDALLIGVPVESVAELKNSPALLDALQAERECSLRNLSELHTLALESTYPHEFPIISAAVFQFAFFRMPKLTNLIFKGCFYTCDMLKEDWEERGRQLIQLDCSQEEDDIFEDDVHATSH